MAGYTTSIINMIVKNLRDEYQFQNGFPILKELIQNADDSKAKRFVFGDHAGFSEANHPLLSGPGLWFFNDGEFKPSDKRAIRSFGENTKAGESGSIGKFGLGMKSVFHLCEAFFYLAYDGVEQHCVLMNPWDRGEDGNIHNEWLEPDTDAQLKLKSIADAHVKDAKTWFLLWIPLRQKRHLQKSNQNVVGAILDRFPGDDPKQDLSFLGESDLQNRLAILLPLLPRLEQIEFYPLNSGWPSFHLIIKTTGRLHTADEKQVSAIGKVLENPSNKYLYIFAGKKYQDATNLFKEIKKQKVWPKTYCWDENGVEKPAEDKSEPEGAVLIGHEENQAGRVDLQWAVFLPLEDHGFECLIPDSSRRYRIVLHGQYSIDAGRRGIYAFQKLDNIDNSALDSLDEASLRRRWNQEVAQRITLPLLLPTLAYYVREHQLKDNEISSLTHSLYQATSKTGDQVKFGERYRDYLCCDYAWVKLIKENGVKWQLISNQQRILPLPPSPLSDPNRPWKLLPGLRLLQDTHFRDIYAPCFQKQSSQWLESDWLAVLSKGFGGAFNSASGMDYLAEFLSMNGDNAWLKTESVQDVLLAGLKSGFSDSFEMLRENRQKTQRVVDALLPERRIKLGPVETDAKRIIPIRLWQALWRCDTRILPLPSYLDGQLNACAKSTLEDVLKWLIALQDEMDGKFAESALQVSGELLKTLDEEQRNALIKRNPTLKIVSAREPRQQKMIAVSFTELETAKQRGNLFASVGDLNKPEGLTSLLAAVLPGESILLLNAENRKVVFPKEILPAANDQKAILASLVNGVSSKKLGDLESRLNLMEYANKTELDHQAMLGLRYLLHGDVNHCKDSTSTLWIRGNGQSSAWEKLWRQITDIQENAVWNVLESRLAEELRVSRSEWSQLKIQEITPDQVINALSGKIDAIQGKAFSVQERIEILLRVNDPDLWRRIPLHTHENGDVAAIKTNTFLSGIVLPKALVSRVHIVAKSEDANLLKKQRHWIAELDIKAGAMVALGTENPVEFCELLLEASKYKAEFDQDNINTYIQKKWLPLFNGQTIAPQDVIDNEALAEDIRRLSSLAEYCYAEANDLAENVRNHAQFDSLRQFFARDPKDVLQNLGLLMEAASASDYAIGQITPENPEKFKQVAIALKKYPKLPGWAVIHNAIESFGPEACINHLLPQAKRTIDTKHVINVLQWLEDKNTPNTIQAHGLYLSLLATENSNIDQILPELRLRSQAANWKLATDLCHDAAGVDPDFLLDNQQARYLTGLIKNANTLTDSINNGGVEVKDIELSVQAAPKIIEDYFATWRGQIRGELIGALLSLLGENVREIAKNYLLPHSHSWLADQLDWQDPGFTKDGISKEWMGGLLVEDALDTFTLVAKKVLDDRVYVPNLIGEPICVPLKTEPDTLVAGSIGGDSRYLTLPLREINPEEYSPETLSTLLRATAEQILRSAYNQPRCNLQALWAELNQSEQLEIDVVRYMLLDQLEFYLRQLGVNRFPIFKPAIEELKTVQNRRAEARHKKNNLKEIEQDFTEKQQQLANLLINDINAQDCVLKAMRSKLEDYQYQPDGILFELFQNADDAAIELGRCESYSDEEDIDIPSAARRFVVQLDGNIVRTFHWGRLINFRGRQDMLNRWPGYGEDLQKMLILSASDKPGDSAVTGRFGLGFKSVFLVTNNPRILSGDLRVQIVGGILPEPWIDAGNTAKTLERQTHERRYRGTAIELPLLEHLPSLEIVHRFQSVAGLLCIFARAIRHIEIGSQQFEWSPQELMPGLEIGTVLITDGKDIRLLVFRLDNHASIAIPLDSRGFQGISKNIPSLWVTAPTRLEDSFGFLISAPFNIDAGRGQLAGNNQDVAQQVGKALGWQLAELSRKCEQNWTYWRQHLVLSDDVTLGEFWASLWKTLSQGWLTRPTVEGGYGLGRTIAITALGILLRDTNHIPTGLPIPFSGWVNRSSIRYKANEAWAQSKILQALENWQLFAQKIDGGFILSEKITDVLYQIDQGSYLPSLNIDGLLTLLDDLCCDSTSAKFLETILSILPEQDAQAESLPKLKFQSRSKDWKISRYLLLVNSDEPEEVLRAAFAPNEYLLSADYNDSAKVFFKRCRPRFDADTERLKEWAFKADQAETQRAVLRYILEGELGGKLAEAMRNNLAGTWLAGFSPTHIALNNWSSNEKVALLRLLMPDAVQQQMQQEYYSNYVPTVPIPPQALSQIYEWWERVGRQNFLQDYIDQLYPHGELPNIELDEDNRIDRTGWMTLFSIGVFQRLGRVRDFQTRGFIEMLEDHGWWQVFCNVDPSEDGEAWLQVLRQFAEDQVDDEIYSHWLDCFPRLFKIASRLEDYASLFQGIELRLSVEQNQLLTPNFDPVLQGSGIDLSPINRTLRKGFNLVIRELLRQEVLTIPVAVPHAYMPTKKLLRLLDRLSVVLTDETSPAIHSALCDILGDEHAIFGGDYDIPLQILARNGNSALIWEICQVDFEDLDEDEDYDV